MKLFDRKPLTYCHGKYYEQGESILKLEQIIPFVDNDYLGEERVSD